MLPGRAPKWGGKAVRVLFCYEETEGNMPFRQKVLIDNTSSAGDLLLGLLLSPSSHTCAVSTSVPCTSSCVIPSPPSRLWSICTTLILPHWKVCSQTCSPLYLIPCNDSLELSHPLSCGWRPCTQLSRGTISEMQVTGCPGGSL